MLHVVTGNASFRNPCVVCAPNRHWIFLSWNPFFDAKSPREKTANERKHQVSAVRLLRNFFPFYFEVCVLSSHLPVFWTSLFYFFRLGSTAVFNKIQDSSLSCTWYFVPRIKHTTWRHVYVILLYRLVYTPVFFFIGHQCVCQTEI